MHKKQIYTVSQLTANIKELLEEKFPFVWIFGEISNFRIPSSKHYYFTIKDDSAQMNAVMFRYQNTNLKFLPEDGMNVTGLGRINVYAPKGTYQIIFEHLEPKGVGALQAAFEQLKKRLSSEGFFDEKYKKKLPFLPKKISIITSPTGAVVQDLIENINRRFNNIHIEIMPVKVQGDGSQQQIANSLKILNKLNNTDIIILARGGGSLEDLYAFNTEIVARATFASKIPVVSAVGHETDYTIADFVADVRASTPSSAAELAVPLKKELHKRCKDLSESIKNRFDKYIEFQRQSLNKISGRLINPKKKIGDYMLRVDELNMRLTKAMNNIYKQKHEQLELRAKRIYANSPLMKISNIEERLKFFTNNLFYFQKNIINTKHAELNNLKDSLQALNPASVLHRGYSITRTLPGKHVVTDEKQISINQDIEVIIDRGMLQCKVTRKSSNNMFNQANEKE